jgi:hypothetical protein
MCGPGCTNCRDDSQFGIVADVAGAPSCRIGATSRVPSGRSSPVRPIPDSSRRGAFTAPAAHDQLTVDPDAGGLTLEEIFQSHGAAVRGEGDAQPPGALAAQYRRDSR